MKEADFSSDSFTPHSSAEETGKTGGNWSGQEKICFYRQPWHNYNDIRDHAEGTSAVNTTGKDDYDGFIARPKGSWHEGSREQMMPPPFLFSIAREV